MAQMVSLGVLSKRLTTPSCIQAHADTFAHTPRAGVRTCSESSLAPPMTVRCKTCPPGPAPERVTLRIERGRGEPELGTEPACAHAMGPARTRPHGHQVFSAKLWKWRPSATSPAPRSAPTSGGLSSSAASALPRPSEGLARSPLFALAPIHNARWHLVRMSLNLALDVLTHTHTSLGGGRHRRVLWAPLDPAPPPGARALSLGPCPLHCREGADVAGASVPHDQRLDLGAISKVGVRTSRPAQRRPRKPLSEQQPPMAVPPHHVALLSAASAQVLQRAAPAQACRAALAQP